MIKSGTLILLFTRSQIIRNPLRKCSPSQQPLHATVQGGITFILNGLFFPNGLLRHSLSASHPFWRTALENVLLWISVFQIPKDYRTQLRDLNMTKNELHANFSDMLQAIGNQLCLEGEKNLKNNGKSTSFDEGLSFNMAGKEMRCVFCVYSGLSPQVSLCLLRCDHLESRQWASLPHAVPGERRPAWPYVHWRGTWQWYQGFRI